MKHTPHTHMYDERFGIGLSALHSIRALRHRNKVTVQSVKVFLYVRRNHTAIYTL